MVKNKFFKNAISGITALSLLLPNFANLAVSAEEPEKFQYTMFGRNGITMSVSSNLCMNGNLHTNKDATITAINKNINGKVTTSADIEKRVKHVYADQKIYDTYFTTNCEVHEEEYVYSDMNIHINNPLFCYSNITLDGNVSLNSSLGTLMNINVTGEVKNANNSVVYSKYGNITIENDSTANVNGLIYAPLGTVTINSPNVTINGIIIADQVLINGSSVNINCNDNIARFIGETSEEYNFSGLEYLPEEWLGDTDEDALFDIYEKVIDSDPFNPDTDTDGLPDGYEVLTLGTNPLEIDTDENGILDCDEDFDTDNLNNLGEYQYQTLPFISDTDEDSLLDGDEVNYYGTIPTDADTDDDKLLDGEEGYNGCIYIEHGVYFDPLNHDTDGNGILDGDEVFGQTKVEEVETYDEAITEVTVDMDTNGNIDRNLTIESMYNIDAMSTNVHALIGEPFNFETESDFESATITFKIDQLKLGDTQFDNLMILWYNEEEQIFEEMPTTHDIVNSTVSTTTTHFSQYMVIDSEKWYDNWENSLNKLRKMWTGAISFYKPMNTILLLDCSYQMEKIDPINYRQIVIGYNGVNEDNFYDITNDMDSPGDVDKNYKEYGKRKCYRAEISENIINQMINDDRAVVMTFSNDVETRTGWSSNWDMLMNGGVSRTSGIQKVNNDGSASFLDNAIQSALSYVEDNAKEAYRIIVITHSDVRCTYNLSSYDYSNVNLNIVNLGSGNISPFLESIVESTGGEVYDAITADELTTQVGGVVTVPPQFVGVDSDGDGIPDIVELYGLKFNGEPIGTNPYKKDTDGDGLYDNEELGYVNNDLILHLDVDCFADVIKAIALKPHTNPTKIDSDGDGISDYLDESPMKPFNHLFELATIDNYSKMMDYIPQSLKEDLDELDNVYATGSSFVSDIAALTVLQADFWAHFLPVGKLLDESGGDMPRASAFLGHFLVASDNLYEYDASEAIACTYAGRNAFNRTVNDLMDIAEESLRDHVTQRVAVKSDRTSFTEDDYAHLMVDFYVKNNPMEFDWTYSIGKGTSSASATLKRDGDKYTMELTLYIIDLYDWDKNDNGNGITGEKTLYEMHVNGDARCYLSVGTYSTIISWKKGERFFDTTKFSSLESVYNDEEYDIMLKSNEIEQIYEEIKAEKPHMFDAD